MTSCAGQQEKSFEIFYLIILLFHIENMTSNPRVELSRLCAAAGGGLRHDVLRRQQKSAFNYFDIE